MTLKIGEKELKVKFAFEPTIKTKVLSRMAKLEKEINNNGGELEDIEEMLGFLPELLLVGLQKYQQEEYGFDYDTGEGKEELVKEMFGLIEEYFDTNEEKDAFSLYQELVEEALKNGILRSRYEKIKAEDGNQEEAEEEQKK